MEKRIIILVSVAGIAAAALLVIFVMPPAAAAPAPAASDKIMSIESYVSQHIADLSPEKEVLGGHFYVTDIHAADGKGVVSYEDGHVAYTADFTYEATDQTGIHISSFTIRQ